MKSITFPTFVFAAGLALSSLFSISEANPPPTINLSVEGTSDELVALEKQKVDYIFGTPEQKRAAVRLYAEDFAGIHIGPAGPEWENYPGVAAQTSLLPNLPPGTFILTDFRVTKLAPGCFVVSYKIKGPGPTGAPWMALNSSTWVKRGRDWTTVFYQTTLISGS